MNKYVYLAAPYTRGDVAANVRRVILAADGLRAAGYIPFVPHLTHFWHLLCPHEIEFWYEYDLEWLRKCDCLVRLPGDSVGADKEVEESHRIGIPVFMGLSELVK